MAATCDDLLPPAVATPRRVVRLLVPSPDRRRVLSRPNGLAGWALPTIVVDEHRAWTAEAGERAAAVLGGPVAPVHQLSTDTWEVEVLDRLPAAGVTWIAPAEADRLGADAGVVRTWSADDPGGRGPHLRPGWLGELRRWIAGHVDPTGPDRVVQHWALAAVVAVPTATGDVVAKHGAPGFDAEAATVDTLAGLPHAPRPLATDGARLLSVWAGRSATRSDRVRVARAHGVLQRGAIERTPALVAAGVPDLAGFGAALDAHADAIEQLVALDLPDSVVHTDAHPGNAVIDDDGAVTIIDWSDAVLACPAIDLDLLVGHQADAPVEDVVAAWADGFGTDPAPILAARPAIVRVAAALAVAQHRRHRPSLPPTAWPWWDEFTAYWEQRLATLV